MIDFDVLINKDVSSPVIFCGIINSKYDYNFYINLKNTLKQKYNISPYFIIFEDLPGVDNEEYFYKLSDKIKEMEVNTFYKWMDNTDIELFYFGDEEVYKYFFEILVNSTDKRINYHFINTKKNKKQNQISFVIKLNLDGGPNEKM